MFGHLGQMPHSGRRGRAPHQRQRIHPEPGMAVYITFQIDYLLRRIATSGTVDGKHTPPTASAKRGVHQVVGKRYHVTGNGFERDRGHVALGYAPEFFRFSRAPRIPSVKPVERVCTRNHPQTARMEKVKLLRRKLHIPSRKRPSGLLLPTPSHTCASVRRQRLRRHTDCPRHPCRCRADRRQNNPARRLAPCPPSPTAPKAPDQTYIC